MFCNAQALDWLGSIKDVMWLNGRMCLLLLSKVGMGSARVELQLKLTVLHGKTTSVAMPASHAQMLQHAMPNLKQ